MRLSIKHLLLRDKMLMSRFGLACGSMLWAFQLALPIELFPTAAQIASGTGRQTYAIMATIAPEWFWAMAFLIHSVWSFYSLLTGVRNTVTLACDGFLGCLLWTTATIACFASHWPRGLPFWDALAEYPPPAAMSADLIMAFYAWWHMIRFWAEEEAHARVCDREHTNSKI